MVLKLNNAFSAEDFKVVQKEVSDLLQNRILVGHSLKHDLKVLFLDHPRKLIRDTSTYKYFRNAFGGKTPSLKRLSERMLGVKVQVGLLCCAMTFSVTTLSRLAIG
jgi:RNA exonuclease 4